MVFTMTIFNPEFAADHSQLTACSPVMIVATAKALTPSLYVLKHQVGFCPDDINSIIKESVDVVLGNQQYNEVKVCGGLP